MDQSLPDPYSTLTFNGYGSFDSNSMPYGYLNLESSQLQSDDLSHSHMKTSSYSSTAEHPPSSLSTASGPSVASASSSTVGSPYSGSNHNLPYQDVWSSHPGLAVDPTIIPNDQYNYDFPTAELESDLTYAIQNKASDDFVDPSLIQPSRSGVQQNPILSADNMYQPLTNRSFASQSPNLSPAQSQTGAHPHAFPAASFTHGRSPQIAYTGMDHQAFARAPSVFSEHSYQSHQSPLSGTFETDEEGRQKGRCPDCGKGFKDLKAHMLTHQAERPEKCPILTCEYNQKGFARKYDKNRHTLTHYKGTMVCGFCPGSGTAAEKSFNRADVFKRHLTSVHGVEQTAPNSRKRSPGSNKKLSNYCPDATGKCSTCSATFNNAQDFYEHLDDCVLRVVQQEEPSEAINQQHLSSVAGDDAVKETLDRHMLNDSMPLKFEEDADEEDDDEEEDEDEEGTEYMTAGRSGKGQIRASKPTTGSSRVVLGANSAITKSGKNIRKGMTFSKGGVPLIGKGRKKRKHYPPSWGMSPDKMKMKKRVLCVYDGERRLWKDDMMLDNEFEVRMKLADGKSYVTDLDVETLKRAEAIHGATEEERGPYNAEQTYGYNAFMPS